MKLPAFNARPVKKLKRSVKDRQLRRRRARVAKKGRITNRKGTIALTLILLLLFGAFAWAQSFLAPKDLGRELTFDEFAALAKETRLQSATFLDEDNRVTGTFVAEPLVEPEETKKDAQAEKKDAKSEKNNGDKDPKNGAGENGKNDKAGKGDKAEKPEPSVAPVGTGTYWLAYPSSDAAFGTLAELVTRSQARTMVDSQTEKGVVRVISTYLLPLLILANFFGLLFTAGRGSTSGIGDIVAFSAIGNKRLKKGFAAPVTFGDVGGADDAVAELKEVVDYLTDPERYEEMGAAPPKGVLLFGPPGCGKTLMAKAVAGEAGVPFFSVAGAEFVESLVGVGAARVRDLFQKVRAVAPAIIFIDELDAAGRKRGSGGSSGGSDEREQTLNQLLVEMDGFEVSSGIVVMGATNRPDMLDPALLRPGRFDRHITVEQPDPQGRAEILELHARSKPLAEGIDFAYLARRTAGFSGADLANVVNEAALLTVRQDKPVIELPELEEAILRVLHGPKRRGRVLTAEERTRIAYHEGGHTLVAVALGDSQDLHRVSILERTAGIGATDLQRQEAEVFTADELYERLVITMAGVATEQLVLRQVSSGGESDLERATELARDMIGRFGLSTRLGRMRLVAPDVNVFLGADSRMNDLSPETHRDFDEEVRALLERAEADAARIVEEQRAQLDALVERLLAEESLEGARLAEAISGVEARAVSLTEGQVDLNDPSVP